MDLFVKCYIQPYPPLCHPRCKEDWTLTLLGHMEYYWRTIGYYQKRLKIFIHIPYKVNPKSSVNEKEVIIHASLI